MRRSWGGSVRRSERGSESYRADVETLSCSISPFGVVRLCGLICRAFSALISLGPAPRASPQAGIYRAFSPESGRALHLRDSDSNGRSVNCGLALPLPVTSCRLAVGGLFVAQRDHGVDSGCAAGWDEVSDQRHHQQ
jgi:hypothetical protein